MPSGERPRESIDDLDALLTALPPEIVDAVNALPDRNALIEVVMDLGRSPEARFPASETNLLEREITDEDIAFVVDHIGSFGDDNRAGIERTLHRISAIRNRNGKIVGLTCRIGRAVYGTIEIINDFVETGKSILIMGRPGIGKTTMLREAARVLADDMGKRVVVVDTSNEIAGDGDIPHPAIGKARRMQVRTPSLQHEVMIEAVENHMPQVIVIDEIGDRERVAVHADVADTIDAMLRGDQVSPELRWRDEEGVHRSQGRPRPSPREQLGAERFAGLVGAGSPWRMEPGWRGEGSYRSGGYREAERGSGIRPGYRPGATGGWRSSRGGAGREPATRGPNAEGGWAGAAGTLPGERFASPPGGGSGAGRGPASVAEVPFVAGDIADRGPLERGAVLTPAETRAREARELQRQKAWADQASRALNAMKAEDGTGPINADDLEDDDLDRLPLGAEEGPDGGTVLVPGGSPLPTLRVLPQGISRKRLEQAVRDLQLPVVIARDVDEADVVMTLRNEYKQKTPMLREAEDRSVPIYVLKSNTIPQMQSSLTSIFSLEIDPREAALRETEDAIESVLSSSEAVELSPQNAYIRRPQQPLAA